jgi:hypothetical protein
LSLRLIVRPDAEADIAAGYDWYEEQREGLGREFVAEVSSTIAAGDCKDFCVLEA